MCFARVKATARVSQASRAEVLRAFPESVLLEEATENRQTKGDACAASGKENHPLVVRIPGHVERWNTTEHCESPC